MNYSYGIFGYDDMCIYTYTLVYFKAAHNLLFPFFSPTLKMEAAGFIEALVSFQKTRGLTSQKTVVFHVAQ